MIKLFKKILTRKSKTLSQDKKHQLPVTDIGVSWYMKQTSKNLPPLRKQKLSKKAQEKDDRIKSNKQAANSNWNDWRFQIHWNMIEWVNPRSKIIRIKYYSTSSKTI